MADPFAGYSAGLESPASRHYSVTPADGTDLDPRPRALRIGGAGNIAIRDEGGTDITYTVTAGEVMTIRAVRVLDTGTTAIGIVAWY